MVPDVTLVSVPIATGFIGNMPVASESCAEKVFPAAKDADTVYAIETAPPAQTLTGLTVPVEIV
jgi:hypothetical protein